MSKWDSMRTTRSISAKWNRYPNDVIPAWIADMDFGVAPEITQRLIEIVSSKDLGYPIQDVQDELLNAFSDRYFEKYNTVLAPDLALVSTDVVQSILISILTLTNPGDGIIVQTPIYPPFLSSVESTGRSLCENKLIETQGGWEIDFQNLEELAKKESTRMLLLCSPHNPTGRVFLQDELVQIGQICSEYNVIVVADEIHCDLVYSPSFHIPFASLSPQWASNVITLNSAAKSFNLAGMRCSIAHFGSEELKKQYESFQFHLRGSISNLGMIGTTTAWKKGEHWLKEIVAQLQDNKNLISNYLSSNGSQIGYKAPEGTYLAWLDFRQTKAKESPYDYVLQHAKVALSPGQDFGSPGKGWARLNFATESDVLVEILDRITKSIS